LQNFIEEKLLAEFWTALRETGQGTLYDPRYPFEAKVRRKGNLWRVAINEKPRRHWFMSARIVREDVFSSEHVKAYDLAKEWLNYLIDNNRD